MDEYVLDHITTDNDIQADLFIPFTITRLQQTKTTNHKALLMVQLENIENVDKSRELLVSWSTDDIIDEKIPLQEHVITEWAAVGIACVLVPLYTDLRILQVTQAGDRFDYWGGSDEWEDALEISGTVERNLKNLHNVKVRQLQRNPYKVDGYVAVIRFSSLDAIFSFNRHEGGGTK